ncbi:MAG: hypothetical protein Q8Q46_04100 [Candidatus Giovannonibacteria bacterium]|nr:hypothetical protein [Candidatus Giovannonibacteria bacterium]
MTSKKIFLITAVFFLSAFFATAAVLKNTGFIQGNIWYSEDPFYVGDTIRIYSAIFNNSGSDLIGIAEFYDGEEKIGSSNFSATNGRLVEVWIDWTVTEGKHKIYAKIVDAKIAKIGGGYEAVDLPSVFTGSNEKSAFTKPVEVSSQAQLPAAQTEPRATDTETATTTFPARIAATIISYTEKYVAAINATADNLAAKVEAKKIEVKYNIATLNTQETKNSALAPSQASSSETAPTTLDTKNNNFQKPLQYMYLASLQALGFVLENKIALYLILGLIFFKLLYKLLNLSKH